jgi:hypothetical protein
MQSANVRRRTDADLRDAHSEPVLKDTGYAPLRQQMHFWSHAVIAMRIQSRSVLLLLTVASLTACSAVGSLTKCDCANGAKADADHAKAPALSSQRLILSQGYSILYMDATKVELSELILAVKVESDAFDKVIKDVSAYGGQLKQQLERIAKDYPGVRIDLDPLPEMEKRKRWALGVDRAKQFAPVVGHGGREYERTVLISLVNAINHERHLCQVMAAEEPDPGLKKFLLKSQHRYDGFYNEALALLDKEHFKDPYGKSKP